MPGGGALNEEAKDLGGKARASYFDTVSHCGRNQGDLKPHS